MVQECYPNSPEQLAASKGKKKQKVDSSRPNLSANMIVKKTVRTFEFSWMELQDKKTEKFEVSALL
jgi:hypothetical protein